MNNSGRILGTVILMIVVLFLIGYFFFGSNPRVALLGGNQLVANPISTSYYPSNGMMNTNGMMGSNYNTSTNSYYMTPGVSRSGSNVSSYNSAPSTYSNTYYSTTTYPTYAETYPNQNCYTSGPDMYGRVTTACHY